MRMGRFAWWDVRPTLDDQANRPRAGAEVRSSDSRPRKRCRQAIPVLAITAHHATPAVTAMARQRHMQPPRAIPGQRFRRRQRLAQGCRSYDQGHKGGCPRLTSPAGCRSAPAVNPAVLHSRVPLPVYRQLSTARVRTSASRAAQPGRRRWWAARLASVERLPRDDLRLAAGQQPAAGRPDQRQPD